MIKYGSRTFKTLQQLNETSLWSGQGFPATLHVLIKSGLATRTYQKRPLDEEKFTFANQYSITHKGREELQEAETAQRIREHEERFFCF